MAKLEKKNLADLIDTKKLDAIETAVNQIHQQSKAEKEKTSSSYCRYSGDFPQRAKEIINR